MCMVLTQGSSLRLAVCPGSFGGGRYGSRRDDILVGRIVKIRSGPYKGYRGRVIEATDTNARIELESMMRVVTGEKHSSKHPLTPLARIEFGFEE